MLVGIGMRRAILSVITALSMGACSSMNGAATSPLDGSADAVCHGTPLDCGDSTKCPWPQSVCVGGEWSCVEFSILCPSDLDDSGTPDATQAGTEGSGIGPAAPADAGPEGAVAIPSADPDFPADG